MDGGLASPFEREPETEINMNYEDKNYPRSFHTAALAEVKIFYARLASRGACRVAASWLPTSSHMSAI